MKSNQNSFSSTVFYETDFTPPPPPAAVRSSQSRISWFQNYDEEWLACIYEHAMEAGDRLCRSEQGSPPRVWNLPAH